MRDRATRFAAAGALLVVAACAQPTPYRPADEGGLGYSETRIEEDRYRVAFAGNLATTREQAEAAVLYRAAELTLAAGHTHFVAVERDTERSTSYVYPFHQHASYGPFLWHRVNRGRAPTMLLERHRSIGIARAVHAYEAIAEIVAFSDEPPTVDEVPFEAEDVLDRLRGEVLRDGAPDT